LCGGDAEPVNGARRIYAKMFHVKHRAAGGAARLGGESSYAKMFHVKHGREIRQQRKMQNNPMDQKIDLLFQRVDHDQFRSVFDRTRRFEAAEQRKRALPDRHFPGFNGGMQIGLFMMSLHRPVEGRTQRRNRALPRPKSRFR
jgi:hypothetical protein